jgi:multiple sugar transport system substrate-binding protein
VSVALITIACSDNPQLERSQDNQSPSETNTLNIWWEKGFNLEEDEAVKELVNNWELKTGHQIELSFYTTSELLEKIERASQMPEPPDLVLSQTGNLTLYPALAWQGKLADVSDVIEPVKSLYDVYALKSSSYYNRIEGKRSYYGIPIYQATIHIFYWQKLLASVGYSSSDIPQDWSGFWQFWQKVQQDLKNQQQKNIYGLGFPLSIGSTDTYLFFEHILEAYDITLVNAEGQLLVDLPEVRQGIVKCLDWYKQFYQQGNIPPDAISWLNTDNNRNLLNRIVLMTPNVTLSIPAAVSQDTDTYYHQLGILEFPNKPSGQPMRYLLSIRQAVILAKSLHQDTAKDFLRYLIEPRVLAEYIKASGNRNLPVQKPIWQDPFWQQSNDPYLASATKILTKEKTRLFYTAQNPAYSLVLKKNVWGQALTRIVRDRISTEQSADEAIAQIKQIFADWD